MPLGIETLKLPALYHRVDHYKSMFALRQRVERSAAPRISFDFTNCSFIEHNAVAFVGALICFAQSIGKVVHIDWESMRSPIRMNLRQNGFAHFFGDAVAPWAGNSIPFRQDVVSAITPMSSKRDEIMSYLKARWLERAWVQVSSLLGNAIRGRVWEIYANSFEHSGSPLGVFTCGQHYPRQKRLGLCAVDFGVGIPENVRRFRGNMRIRAADALRWAFERGNSTNPGTGRGLGLDILRDFVRLNDGQLDVYSDGAHVAITATGTFFEEVPEPFRGTIVDIRLICDESRYVLASEVPRGPLF